MHRVLCAVLALVAVLAEDSDTVDLAPMGQLISQEAELQSAHGLLEQKKGKLIEQAREAEAHALKGAAVLETAAQDLGAPPEHANVDPVANAKKTLSGWLIRTAPLPPEAGAPKPGLNFLQRALKKARLEAKVAGVAQEGAMGNVVQKLELMSMRASQEPDGEEFVLDRSLRRERMRLQVKKAYYEGYVDSDAPREHVDDRLLDYQCQQDKLVALEALEVQKPSPKERSNMCQRMLKRWETKRKIALARMTAVSVAEKHKKNCLTEPEAVHLKVATYKLMAIKTACPNMDISTDEPSERNIRVAIRREIANQMVARLEQDPVTVNTWALREARKTLRDLFQ